MKLSTLWSVFSLAVSVGAAVGDPSSLFDATVIETDSKTPSVPVAITSTASKPSDRPAPLTQGVLSSTSGPVVSKISSSTVPFPVLPFSFSFSLPGIGIWLPIKSSSTSNHGTAPTGGTPSSRSWFSPTEPQPPRETSSVEQAFTSSTTDVTGKTSSVQGSAKPSEGATTGTTHAKITSDGTGVISTTYTRATSVTDSAGVTLTQPTFMSLSLPPSSMITSSASVIAARFHNIVLIVKFREGSPEPRPDKQLIDIVKRIKDDMADLAKNMGEKLPKCNQKKRGLFDGLMNFARDTTGQILHKLGCLENKLDELVDRVKKKDIKGVKDIVKALDIERPPDGPESSVTNGPDNDQRTSSRSSSSSSSSCTLQSTAHHVTILCQPTSITTGGSTVSTTTCTRTTAITTTGCSVTATTTTITNTPSSTPTRRLCAQGECGASCLAGKGGWVSISSVECASIPTSIVAALPTGNGGTIYRRYVSAATGTGVKASNQTYTFVKRALKDLSDVDPNQYLSKINHDITQKNQWASQSEPVTGKWYRWPNLQSALGVKGLHGCTQTFTALSTGRTGPAGQVNNQIEPLQDLWGTDANPGPLHRTNNPQLIIVTPFLPEWQPQEYMYARRVKWLAAQFNRFLYFPTGEAPADKAPIIRGYEPTDFWKSNNDDSSVGKVVIEVDKYNSFLQAGNHLLAVGQWRLWLCGQYVMDYDFWDPAAVLQPVAQPQGHMQRRDRCPGRFISVYPTLVTSTKSVAASTTSSSTTKSATTTPTPQISDQTCLPNRDFYQPLDSHVVDTVVSLCWRGTQIPSIDFEMGPDSKPLTWSSGSPTLTNWQYRVTITWVKGCKGPKQKPIAPTGQEGTKYTCENIVKDNFSKCVVDHRSYGGSRVFGCLEYRGWMEY
ncbi:hypothetical protein BO82DRAFT_420308 [Aspergillus uvarum CBS 121591]|uniref:Uncharacterized protein n=1 Tax=Aspergillus uvarum CBS 121591 TaxID=1448315 RepID=A0A319CSH0_9EURO|nr:hypothetical protein BO82DRAFT_420308 [Aspergillus uvarum CBS 121591]PYH85787.1 hypothetical protein BO82DRAFT_420308 [Aspergillus uvarum CBS 121591]